MNARITMYRGQQMKSRIEARVAGWLDEMALSWQYEPFAYAAYGLQYLPDFIVTDALPRHRRLLIEVKPPPQPRSKCEPRLAKQGWCACRTHVRGLIASTVFDTDPDILIAIAEDGQDRLEWTWHDGMGLRSGWGGFARCAWCGRASVYVEDDELLFARLLGSPVEIISTDGMFLRHGADREVRCVACGPGPLIEPLAMPWWKAA